jgi:ankyrin repeat protein
MSEELNKIARRLRYEIKKENNAEAKSLIDKLGVNFYIEDSGTPLLLACLHNNTEIAFFCLEKGADVNIKDPDMNSALMYACMEGNFPVIKSLIEKGADVNVVNKYDATPILHLVSKYSDNLEIIETLLKAGADPFFEQQYKKDHPNKIANSTYEYAKVLKLNKVVELIDKYNKR